MEKQINLHKMLGYKKPKKRVEIAIRGTIEELKVFFDEGIIEALMCNEKDGFIDLDGAIAHRVLGSKSKLFKTRKKEEISYEKMARK